MLFTLTCTVSATAQPTVTIGATAVNPGEAVGVTVAGGPGNRVDWVGLYQTSASDRAYIGWQYLNGSMTAPASGVTGATLQFTAPLTPGTYNLRFFSNNGYTLLAASLVVTVRTPTVTLAAATVTGGAAISVTVASGPANRLDWVGLYQSSGADTAYNTWQYLSGSRTPPASGVSGATLQFTAPMSAGTYNVRFFTNDGYLRLATSAVVTVVGVPTPTVSLAATTVDPGAAIDFTVSDGPGSRFDWVGLYQTSAPDNTFIAWQYLDGSRRVPLNGVAGATLRFTAPMAPGLYSVRFFTNNDFTRLATSPVITVPPPTVTLAAATVNAGEAINFTVARGPANRTDWVGLYRSSASDTEYVAWQYLNGSKVAPASGVTGATLQFTAPMTAGMYDVRFFSNNEFIRLATSESLTVRPVTLAVSAYVSGVSIPVALIPDPLNPNVQFVVELDGRIRVIQSGVLQPTAFLDLSAQVTCCFEQGLFALAFPPDHATSRRFYVHFTDLAGNTTVARFHRSLANPLVADVSSQFNFRWGGAGGLRYIPQPFQNHNGGCLVFGPDGYLYLGLGDGGSVNDPFNFSQNPGSFLGKMLRIDVNVPDGNADGYVVPADNPFRSSPPALPEIWAFGLRNPWKCSFDDGPGGTDAFAIGDVGQSAWEEVDFEPSGRGGRNYGWSHREGAHITPFVNRPPTTGAPALLTDPTLEYGHTGGESVTGGYVYRGNALGPGFKGRYFFGDYVRGRVWSVRVDVRADGEFSVSDLFDHTDAFGGPAAVQFLTSFGRDADGELYLLQYTGRILKIVPGQ